jgi:hypothetical protein
VYFSRWDISDQFIVKLLCDLFKGNSGFMDNDQEWAVYAAVTEEQVIEAATLPPRKDLLCSWISKIKL